ncbi:adenylosuccinate lyase [Acidovorax sp. GBBC 3334]|uniref:adenylosuccinate lyase n=1 Tax=Acidovorax sp. GBBC 3334 TaxID=2940496 RepID=UPI002FE20C79
MAQNISVFDMLALQHLWSSAEMRAIFSEEERIRAWLKVESAVARAQGSLGIIPAQAARRIVEGAAGFCPDIESMASGIRTLRHSLVPFLRQLQGHIGDEGEWLHHGITTQDVIDTGMVLQMRQAHRVYLRDIDRVADQLIRLARLHRDTIMVGRTHGMHALPTTFGHKCAVWLDEMSRHRVRLLECESRVFVGMLGGAVGTQAGLGPKARDVEVRVLQDLGLGVPDICWASARDRFAEYAGLLAMLGATLSKIGNELFNLQRDEVGELAEACAESAVGSSTMPHKRNPAAAENLAGLARSMRYSAAMMTEAMVQEHERDGVAWKTEWKALPECCLVAGAMLEQAVQLLSGLAVDAEAMSRNLDRRQGYLLSERVMLSLGPRLGKQTAHAWVHEASMDGLAQNLDFRSAMARHGGLAQAVSEQELDEWTDPRSYLGSVRESIDRTIRSYESMKYESRAKSSR